MWPCCLYVGVYSIRLRVASTSRARPGRKSVNGLCSQCHKLPLRCGYQQTSIHQPGRSSGKIVPVRQDNGDLILVLDKYTMSHLFWIHAIDPRQRQWVWVGEYPSKGSGQKCRHMIEDLRRHSWTPSAGACNGSSSGSPEIIVSRIFTVFASMMRLATS